MTSSPLPDRSTGPPASPQLSSSALLPSLPSRPVRRGGAGDALAGVPAALWVLGAGLVATALPVLLAWAADPRSASSAAAALRVVAWVWLAAHGAQLQTPGGPLGLVPLGLTAVPLLLLVRAGRQAAAARPPGSVADVVRTGLALAAPYALGVAVIAALAGTPAADPSPASALLGASVLALAGTGAGLLRDPGAAALVRDALPAGSGRVVRAAAVAAATLLGAGAALVAGSLAVHLPDAVALAARADAGLVGGGVLLVLGVALAPNAAVWGAGWLAGPGFAVGDGATVGPSAAQLGPLTAHAEPVARVLLTSEATGTPPVPLLAAVPDLAPAPQWALLALGLPVAAGLLAGLVLARQGGRPTEAAAVGLSAGALLALAVAASAGPLGDGRLSVLGPSPWQVGLAVAGEVGLGAWLSVRLRVPGRAATPC